MAVDDNKRQHDVKLWLTDREFLDLCKMAEREDRKTGEMARVIIRRSMYGTVACTRPDGNGTNGADQGTPT